MKNGVKGIKSAVLYPVIKLQEGHCSLLVKKIVFGNMLLVIMVLCWFYCSLIAHLLLTAVVCAMWCMVMCSRVLFYDLI